MPEGLEIGHMDRDECLPTKRLRLVIEVPEWWADDYDERLRYWVVDGEEPSPVDLLDMFTEEDMQPNVVLSVVGISHGEDPDRLLAFDGRIVGVEVVDV